MKAISRLTTRLTPVVALGAAILLVGGAGVASAATGGTFILGHSNSASTLTTLTNTAGTALRLNSPAGVAPLIVNSTAKVPNLNADKLDGLSSEQFQRKLGRLVFTPMTLLNGWDTDCYSAGVAGVAVSAEGVIHFRGDLCNPTSGAAGVFFVLPVGLRPSNQLILDVDECGGNVGRLIIYTDGQVQVTGSTADANSADCFVSLSGIDFTLPY